jgi:hypothetical protein
LKKSEADVEVSTGICQQGEAEHKISCKSSREDESNNNNKAMERMDSSRELFGIQVDFNK